MLTRNRRLTRVPEERNVSRLHNVCDRNSINVPVATLNTMHLFLQSATTRICLTAPPPPPPLPRKEGNALIRVMSRPIRENLAYNYNAAATFLSD